MAHTSTEHEVLAVVFQVRESHLPLGKRPETPRRAVMAARPGPERGKWSLPGGRVSDDEDLTQFGATPTRRESGPARGRPPRTAGGVLRTAPGARCPRDRLDLPRLGALPRHPGAAVGHPLAPGQRTAADGLRPRPDGRPTPAPAWPPNSPTPISDSLWHQRNSRCRRCATSTAPPSATRSTPPTCSGSWPAAA